MNGTPTWRIQAKNRMGLSIDNTGVLSVESTAVEQDVEVIAEFLGFADSFTYKLVKQKKYEKGLAK